MSIKSIITVYCDGSCPATFTSGHRTAGETRPKAAEAGWVHQTKAIKFQGVQSFDYCPEHAHLAK